MRDIPASGLDSVRAAKGAEACIAVFTDACKRGVRAAAMMLGEIRTYPTFFILMPQVKESGLHPYLSPLKRSVYDITNQILAPQKPSVFGDSGIKPADNGMLSEKNAAEHSALKWMIETGYKESLGGEYDEALDVAASVLINLYEDKSVLPLVADIIFTRGRAGRNIHDLSWAFFRSRDPEALRLVAQHMDSKADLGLACSLLGVEDVSVMAGGKRSGDYLKWLEENKEYLYFTDECFQLTSKPSVCAVNLERKYMQKRTQPHGRNPVSPVGSDESSALTAFRQLNGDDQEALSEYSQKLSGDKAKWSEWMKLPLGEQLEEARKGGGVWL